MQYFFTALTLGALSAAVLGNSLPTNTSAQSGDVPGAFSLIAIRSTTPIHLQAINANKGKFFIGKKTLSYCPKVNNIKCPPGNVTAFHMNAYDKNGHLSMDVEIPGGQRAYVGPRGVLSMTFPHSNLIPLGGHDANFRLSKETKYLSYDSKLLKPNTPPWTACPVPNEKDVYQVIASTRRSNRRGCIDFEAAVAGGPKPETPAAWQYESSIMFKESEN